MSRKNKNRKPKKKSSGILVLFIIGLIVLFAFGNNNPENSISNSENSSVQVTGGYSEDEFENSNSSEVNLSDSEDTENAVSGDVDGEFSVTMLDVDQGLSLLINADGHYMIYDGGGRSKSSYVVSYLKSHNVTDVDIMVASHYDDDHINGLVGVLNTTNVKTVLLPDYTKDTNIYKSLMNKVNSSDVEVERPVAGDRYTLGNAKIQVISPKSYSALEDNNNSIVVRITYGYFSMIVTGDAEEEAEASMLSSGYNIDSDLYVVGHHGSSTSTSASFLNAVSPSYVFLSVGEDNSYGHPTESTMNKLKNCGAEMFRTDVQGEVTLTYESGKIETSQAACTDWSYRTYEQQTQAQMTKEADAGTQVQSSNETTYVLNVHTKKFHYPTCGSVKQIKDENRQNVNTTRDVLISQGYEPCGNCNP